MKSSDDYCPVAKSVEVLGDRWCLLLVREMLRGVDHFNELERSVPGISRSILAQRLRHLEREGIVERRVGAGGRATGYQLTGAGVELGGGRRSQRLGRALAHPRWRPTRPGP